MKEVYLSSFTWSDSVVTWPDKRPDFICSGSKLNKFLNLENTRRIFQGFVHSQSIFLKDPLLNPQAWWTEVCLGPEFPLRSERAKSTFQHLFRNPTICTRNKQILSVTQTLSPSPATTKRRCALWKSASSKAWYSSSFFCFSWISFLRARCSDQALNFTVCPPKVLLLTSKFEMY